MFHDGDDVGLKLGFTVSPNCDGLDDIGAALGFPVGWDVGLLEVGLTVG